MREGRPPLELWGGLECSVVRVGDDYRDQLGETGHRARPGDLDAIAALGIRTIRYPVLWETVSPDHPDKANFRWHDARMARLKRLGVEPVVGLVHHGSGPRYTDLLDLAFPEKLARHAARVARRYPHVRAFTPLNEPLTTARFSTLYGVWYPHLADMRPFARAMINQARATLLAMRAIRAVIPDARLVQTEDMGKTFSTPALAYQADFENERRWLSFDLLFGRVGPRHPWYRIFLDNGIEEHELAELREEPVPPDVIGINYYLTSERFLEHREERWPSGHPVGGNGRHRYADMEAVRTRLSLEDLGIESRLREVWERYRTPIAVTEAHLGCSREEQLRWLSEIWRSALKLRRQEVDIRAVTIWSMFGAVDWNSLLQRRAGHYEPGAFDIRTNGAPRATALAAAARALCREGDFDHPVLDGPGWWRREDRYHGPKIPSAAPAPRGRRILVVAPAGETLDALRMVLEGRGLAYSVVDPAHRVLSDPDSRLRLGGDHGAWAVVAALPEAGDDPSLAFVERVARESRLPLLHIKTSAHDIISNSLDLFLDSAEPPRSTRREQASPGLMPHDRSLPA